VRRHATSAGLLALCCAFGATASATAQERSRDELPPPPSAKSTGGERPAPIDVSHPPTSPKVHGMTLETRGELYHGEAKLAGLDVAESAKRRGLTIEPTRPPPPPVGVTDLHDRQLAIHRGELLTVLPDPHPAAALNDAASSRRDGAPHDASGAWLGYGMVALVAAGAVALRARRRTRR
jgi:hypothetical protein